MKEITIRDRFRLGRKIAEGGCGLVYSGTDLHTGKKVAIKLESVQDAVGEDTLEREARILARLAGGTGVPRALFSGTKGDYHVLVTNRLGPSLQDLFDYCGRRFSVKTVLLIASQLITRLGYIHSKSLVHRDVKPENFLIGMGEKKQTIHVIDFGIAAKYNLHHLAHGDIGGHVFCGTNRYASIGTHIGLAPSPRDDMESLGYMLIFLAKGSLPWGSIKCPTEQERQQETLDMKLKMTSKKLCAGLPSEFAAYMRHVRSLKPAQLPHYSRLRDSFNDLLYRQGFVDDEYDWNLKKMKEARGKKAAGAA